MTETQIRALIREAADELAEIDNREDLDDNHYGFVEALVRRVAREATIEENTP